VPRDAAVDWLDAYKACWLVVAVLVGCCAFALVVLAIIAGIVRLAG
jgi:hypothetical protein